MSNIIEEEIECNRVSNINIEEAQKFLSLLDLSASKFWFRTVDDDKARKSPVLAKTLHGSLAELLPTLQRLQAEGAAIYVTVQQTENGAKAADVSRVRAIFAELDNGMPELWPLTPSLVIESSPGKYHCYWIVDGLWPADDNGRSDFASVMESLIADYKHDPNAKDLARVMRVPGFYHQKDPNKRFRSRIIEASGKRYSRAEILKAFPPVSNQRRRRVQNTIVYDRVQSALMDGNALLSMLCSISPNDYETWVKVGMALKKEHGEAGFRFWKAWSSTSSKYNHSEIADKWASFDDEEYLGKPVSIGTVAKLDRDARKRDANNETLVAKRTARFDAMVKLLPEDFPGEESEETRDAVKELAQSLGIELRGGNENKGRKAFNWSGGTTTGGKPTAKSQANLQVFLTVSGITLYFDEFTRKIHMNGFLGYDQLDDNARAQLTMAAHREGLDLEDKFLKDALLDIALRDKRHPLKNYLKESAKEWNGKSKIKDWLIDYAGAQPTELNKAIGERVLMAAVARVFQPGIKFDQLLVLQGSQGAGKSTLIKIMGGEWFDDCLTLGMSPKDVMEQSVGKWLCEISELDGSKRERERIKAMLSRTTDRAALKYEKFASDFHRNFVLIGTTNQEAFINDPTGGRRYWPVKVGTVKLKELRAARDQLWGEAAHRVIKAIEAGTLEDELKLPEPLWNDAAEIQRQASFEDAIYETLSGVIGDRSGRIATETIFDILGFAAEDRRNRLNPVYLGQVRETMERLGWRKTRLPLGDVRPRGYEKDGPESHVVWECDDDARQLIPSNMGGQSLPNVTRLRPRN